MTPEAERVRSIPDTGGKSVSTWRADAALVGNTIIWGATFVVVQSAVKDISPLLFVAIRFSIATAALALLFRGRVKLTPIRGGLLAGICLFAGYVVQTIGLQFTTASKSAFITGLTIPLVPLLTSIVYLQRPKFFDTAGVVCATIGMGLMTLQGDTMRIGRGDLITLGCAFAFAAHIIVLGHYSGRMSFESISFLQVGVAAALGVCTFWWAETPAVHWSPMVLFALGVTGLLATALAFTIQAWAQQHTTPTRTAIIFALEPVMAWITSYCLTGEVLSRRAVGGATLILAGILLVELKRVHSEEHLSSRRPNPEV
jgi:drug/metabolite transporter (DMT)-like permease